jgi:TorA maturation chaperone TorD
MTMTAEVRRDLVEATGRYTVYALLANGLSFPTSERLRLIRTRLVPAVEKLVLPAPLDGEVGSLASTLEDDLDIAREQYMGIFPPIASQDAPGYETAYRGEGIFQQSALMADIAGFYRAHGLQAGGTERERTDHITVELEFMAFVAKKEALAIQENDMDRAGICQDTSALFLQDHLGCWGPAFGRRATAVSESPWMTSMGRLTADWIEYDLAAYGVEPTDVVDTPLPQDPPDDGACGPCPGPAGMAGP